MERSPTGGNHGLADAQEMCRVEEIDGHQREREKYLRRNGDQGWGFLRPNRDFRPAAAATITATNTFHMAAAPAIKNFQIPLSSPVFTAAATAPPTMSPVSPYSATLSPGFHSA